MSVSSNSRKESTESYAAQQMHNTMGIAPELAQLNDKNLDNELPSRVASSNDTDVPGDVAQIDARIAENEDNKLPADAEDATTDAENPMNAYQQPEAAADGTVEDADWNRSTQEGAIPATRANEPDRTLGNS
ncbi:hypothetical protein [Spirosoma luteolum]